LPLSTWDAESTTTHASGDGGSPGRPDCPAEDRCIPEQMRGTNDLLKGTHALKGGKEVRGL